MRIGLIAAVAAGVMGLAGCDSSDDAVPPLGDYRLVSMDGVDVTDRSVTLSLADGQVSGQGFCNQFNGPQTAQLPALQIGPLAVTRKACISDLMQRDQAYFDALTAAESTSFADDRMTISGSGPDLVFAPDAG